ncbi:protein crumbs homolog 3 [Taeniopygia guttata]|uniref:protein crumbs homolog 3 n=1 Tax=Taeniopygia guttata TaxID=59729 RepID=UPI003BB936EB
MRGAERNNDVWAWPGSGAVGVALARHVPGAGPREDPEVAKGAGQVWGPPMAAPPLGLALALPCLALAQTSPSLTSNGPGNGTAPQPGGGLSAQGVLALSLVLGGLGALGLGALLLLAALRLREKRRTEGSYRPSREELGGGARGAPPGPPPLRLPPEERLI